ncbi:MAG: 50S ribosomal protein L3 [Planctomycetes bacterium]|nr:50S ribosomal protein L3 [Planctomycetota bacterium]
MPLGLLGLKVGMTQIYDDKGKIAPVTVLAVGPCPVLQVREPERDGYHAVQIGFLDKPRKKAIRAESGHVAANFASNRKRARQAAGVKIPDKADCEPQRHIREFRLGEAAAVKVGEILNAAGVFKDVKAVDVIGTSKGRGFTGAMKRHNFQGLPAAHGAKKVHRSAGSIGSHASNRGSGRPKKGHAAAGQYGNTRVTSRNLDVVRIDADNHLMMVRGAVPGPNGGLVVIRPTNKKG